MRLLMTLGTVAVLCCQCKPDQRTASNASSVDIQGEHSSQWKGEPNDKSNVFLKLEGETLHYASCHVKAQRREKPITTYEVCVDYANTYDDNQDHFSHKTMSWSKVMSSFAKDEKELIDRRDSLHPNDPKRKVHQRGVDVCLYVKNNEAKFKGWLSGKSMMKLSDSPWGAANLTNQLNETEEEALRQIQYFFTRGY